MQNNTLRTEQEASLDAFTMANRAMDHEEERDFCDSDLVTSLRASAEGAKDGLRESIHDGPQRASKIKRGSRCEYVIEEEKEESKPFEYHDVANNTARSAIYTSQSLTCPDNENLEEFSRAGSSVHTKAYNLHEQHIK